MRKIFFITLGCGLVVALVLWWRSGSLTPLLFQPRSDQVIGEEGRTIFDDSSEVRVWAEELAIPWEIVWLPDDTMLVTERAGRLLRIDEDRVAVPVQGVEHAGEGGLLGLALHPHFAENGWLYVYLTTVEGGALVNRVERYVLENTTLRDRVVILDAIPGARFHDGGRIAFGPDGMLYVATGDAGQEMAAQDARSLAGKILRLTDQGAVPPDNPFGNFVYSYGHRNVQGLAWDAAGQLWATEHGRSGFQSGFDEINLIEPGGNYGWPIIEGDGQRTGMIAPVAHSGSSTTWAPAGATVVDNQLLFVGLRGSALYAAELKGRQLGPIIRHFGDTWGRLRVIRLGPDGALYLATSNRDGRGSPVANDDRILTFSPDILQ